MSTTSRVMYAITFIITAVGFLLPFWPLMLAGIFIAAASGRYVFAVLVALLVDVGSGAPTGIVRFAYMPFTAFAVIVALMRVLGDKYFLDKTPPDTL